MSICHRNLEKLQRIRDESSTLYLYSRKIISELPWNNWRKVPNLFLLLIIILRINNVTRKIFRYELVFSLFGLDFVKIRGKRKCSVSDTFIYLLVSEATVSNHFIKHEENVLSIYRKNGSCVITYKAKECSSKTLSPMWYEYDFLQEYGREQILHIVFIIYTHYKDSSCHPSLKIIVVYYQYFERVASSHVNKKLKISPRKSFKETDTKIIALKELTLFALIHLIIIYRTSSHRELNKYLSE